MNEDFLNEVNSFINKKKELIHYIEWVQKENLTTNFDRFIFNEIKENFKNQYLKSLNNELDIINQEINKFEINKK